MSRYYVAGPISGLPDVPTETKIARFHRAEAELVARGHEVCNPLTVEIDACPGECNPDGHVGQDGVPTHSWECFMRHDLRALLLCDGIALLPGWTDSRGATTEVYVASMLGLRTIWLTEDGVPITDL